MTYTGADLGSGQAVFARLVASIPTAAAYLSKEAIHFDRVRLNGSDMPGLRRERQGKSPRTGSDVQHGHLGGDYAL